MLKNFQHDLNSKIQEVTKKIGQKFGSFLETCNKDKGNIVYDLNNDFPIGHQDDNDIQESDKSLLYKVVVFEINPNDIIVHSKKLPEFIFEKRSYFTVLIVMFIFLARTGKAKAEDGWYEEENRRQRRNKEPKIMMNEIFYASLFKDIVNFAQFVFNKYLPLSYV